MLTINLRKSQNNQKVKRTWIVARVGELWKLICNLLSGRDKEQYAEITEQDIIDKM